MRRIRPVSTATERIAAKLAARKAAQETPKPEPVEDEELEVEDTEEDDDLLPGEEPGEIEAEDEQPARLSIAQRAKAAREARAAKSAPAAKTKGKQPSPAQLAARAAFAERSRAAAAAKKEAAPLPPAQTEAEIKAKQNAARKAEKEALAAKAAVPKPKAVGTSKPVTIAAAKKVVKTTLPPASAAKAKVKTAAAKAPEVKKAAGASRGTTKTKILALWEKGRTRREIAEALDLSYAAVFFHTKGLADNGASGNVRGRIFIAIEFDGDGKKLGKGKTEQVSRSEAMRRLYLSGMTIGDVARHFEVRYQLAYTACRPLFATDEE
jgi:hypothetical protein